MRGRSLHAAPVHLPETPFALCIVANRVLVAGWREAHLSSTRLIAFDILSFEGVKSIMRPLIRIVTCLTLAGVCAYGQAGSASSFEVASIRPASPNAIRCSGGPGTADPVLWRCFSVPVGLLITRAYDFQAYQFRPNDPCCVARFDIAAKLQKGATKEQFQRMLQNLLGDRFKLELHREQKEMAIYELTVGEKGSKMKESVPGTSPEPEDPWALPEYSMGKDGYPVFPVGRSGLAGPNGHYRWIGFDLSMQEIVRTLSFHLGRPVVDATGLKGKYDIDMRWGIDVAWLLERSGYGDEVGELPDTGPLGPPLTRAVQDQLGLKLQSRKGVGDVVVIDHLEKVPTEN